MRITLPGALAGMLLALAPATALAGPTVSVRVEGQSATLLERTVVTLPDVPPPVPGGCARYRAGAALEEATKGNWDRSQFTSTILGETHQFADSDYWAEWVDRGQGYQFGSGICVDRLEDGDELLMLVDRAPAPAFVPTVFPLDLEGLPATAQVGTTVGLTVVEYRTDGTPGTSQRVPVEGATISGGGASATTGPDGVAQVRLDQTGTVVLKAARAGSVPSAAEVVTVTPPVAQPTPVAPADVTPPRPRIARLRPGAVYRARRAPRLLRGTVSRDPSGVRAVELSIVRQRRGGRCAFWSARRERFRSKACNGPAYFQVGTEARWSYLLPRRLPFGRYYVRVAAVDGAGNRASTRVIFRVR
jgi:hypothetical protein